MCKLIVYTDGACTVQGDLNPGGWGAILKYGDNSKEMYGSAIHTTNNQMEFTAAIEALSCIKNYNIPTEVYSDSNYVVNCFNQHWVDKWKNNGFRTADKKPISNKDLILKLDALVSNFKDIKFIHVKGHADNELNNRVDALVVKGKNEALNNSYQTIETKDNIPDEEVINTFRALKKVKISDAESKIKELSDKQKKTLLEGLKLLA